MTETRSRIKNLATLIKVAQMALPGAQQGMGGNVDPNAGGGVAAMGAATPEMPEQQDAQEEMGIEDPSQDQNEEEETNSSLDKPTSWLVKYDKEKGIFWLGKAFPKKNIDQVVSEFSQRKSVPKAQVREFLEKLMEGKDEKMPAEMAQAPEISEGGEELPAEGMPGGAPQASAGMEGAALDQMM